MRQVRVCVLLCALLPIAQTDSQQDKATHSAGIRYRRRIPFEPAVQFESRPNDFGGIVHSPAAITDGPLSSIAGLPEDSSENSDEVEVRETSPAHFKSHFCEVELENLAGAELRDLPTVQEPLAGVLGLPECDSFVDQAEVYSQKRSDDKKEEAEEFVCPEGQGNGNFADPATCRRFYQCVDNYPYLNRCPSGLYFDDINKLCTFKNEARCGPLPATPAPSTESPQDLAQKCDTSKCILPYCFCSRDGTIIPGGLEPDDTPQMILITFDGAINQNNFQKYTHLFNDQRSNPNGCELKATFFISHEYCDYNMVQELAHYGHEIGVETVSLQQGLQDKGYEEWVGEMIGMREILRHFANISRADVVGMRAPFLKPGRNTQYEVVEDFGFIYDSSVGVPPVMTPIWPYTLDYKIPHECKSGTCPTKSFPGIWEVPLNAHYVATFEGGHCPYLDQCVLHNHDKDDVFEWLQEDFYRSYKHNRAPYMLPFHTNWFQLKELEDGLHKFIDWVLTLDDVYFVTVTQALTWMTDPRPIKDLTTYEPWKCDKKDQLPSAPCNLPNKCALSFRPPEANVTATRYLTTCRSCPNKYPWLGDSEGTGIAGRDVYNPENRRKR